MEKLEIEIGDKLEQIESSEVVMKYYKDINNIVNDMLTIGNETKKREKELMEEEKNYNDKSK